ncbi:PAS domain S-box protein [Rhodobacteraceae bacterium 2CG4]|uniref:histidine kinase n=1 Tax=Halovulum marinum TaxID=2662447 RepID=A0A6L5Z3B5_9RHOB|nr:MASE1 domain-containing protein [Halovulum marinum]MSU91017.1 PAS domain S-box protein [Halovulum marinum]
MNRSQRLAPASASVSPEAQARRRPPQTWRLASSRPDGAALAAFLVAYMLGAAFGRWLMVIPGIPITVWPPNGVILAMLLTQPRQSWPWWLAVGAAGELTGNLLWFHNPLGWALGYVAANAAAVTAAAFCLAPYLRTPVRRLATLPMVLAFLGIGVLAAPVVSATLGSAIDAIVGKNPFATTWPIWWLGDATGILIATPLVISAINVWRDGAWPTSAQLLEGAAIGLVLAGLSAWEMITGAAHAFLLPLPVLWAALRFEFRGTALAVLGLALAIGVHAQTIDTAQVPAADVALLHARLQAQLLVAAATGLIVAAIMRQQRQAVSGLARANAELEARVAERTRAIEAAERRFKATFENAGVGISIVDGDGNLMRVNDSLAKMLGYDPDEMEGHSIDRFTHPDDRALGDAAWDRLESGAADDYELEKRYIRKDGVPVWAHTTVSCVRHPDGQIAYLIKIIQDITARRRSDEVRQMLTREVHHRSKNLMTIVQVIARQTAARSPNEFVRTFRERLQALAANQDLLVKSEWQHVALPDLVRGQLQHFGATGGRFVLSGPPVTVPPAAAQALGMALHELATNAAKYGSLSTETGRVEISWAVDADTFCMSWRETGGPEVAEPETCGFGTTVLDAMTATAVSGEVSIDYAPAGLVWQLRCPLSALRSPAGREGPA